MPVERQHVHRLKGLVVNQSHLLLADTTTYRSLQVQIVSRTAVRVIESTNWLAQLWVSACHAYLIIEVEGQIAEQLQFSDVCAYTQTYNALPLRIDMKQQGCKVILEGSEEVVTRKVWEESW